MDKLKHDNFISVDLEDWYSFGYADVDQQGKRAALGEPRIVKNTIKLLGLFEDFSVSATFFVLGAIAQEFPDLVRLIAKEGHEIASHGWQHVPLWDLTKGEFITGLQKSRDLLFKISGQEISGFRAPYFSGHNNEWLFDILSEAGFLYDSSLKAKYCRKELAENGFYYKRYCNNKVIVEFPILSQKLLGFEIGFSGGAYFRMLPLWWLRETLNDFSRKRKPVNFYLHPRDIDHDLPRVRLSFLQDMRYRGHLGKTEDKLRFLLANFKFVPFRNFLRNTSINNA